MRSTSIVFSLLFFFAPAAMAAPFQPWAIKLLSDTEDSISAKAELAKMGDLDEQLKAAIAAGGREQMLAFRVMGALSRVDLVPWLIERTRGLDRLSEETTLHLTALAAMSDTREGEKILKFLSQHIDLTEKKVPVLSRLAVLTAWDVKEAVPPLPTVEKLLSDDDAQIRQKTMELLEANYRGDQAELVPVLKKAFTLSPYPIRMRAAVMTTTLPPVQKLKLQAELKKCQADEREEVRSACKSALEMK